MNSTTSAGSFARVHRGSIGIQRVAVKVVHDMSEATFTDGVADEAITMLQHTNILQMHKSLVVRTASGETRLWLILEYCDMGSLAVSITFLNYFVIDLILTSNIIAVLASE